MVGADLGRVKAGYLPGATGRLEAEGSGQAADTTSEAAGCVVSSLMHVGDVLGAAPATIPCGIGVDDGPHQLALNFWEAAQVCPAHRLVSPRRQQHCTLGSTVLRLPERSHIDP